MVVYIEEAMPRSRITKSSSRFQVRSKALRKTTATLINGVTEAVLETEKVEDNGKFKFEVE